MRVAAYSGRPLDALMGLLWGTVDRYLLGDPMADRWLAELGGRPRPSDTRRWGSSSTPCASCSPCGLAGCPRSSPWPPAAPRPESGR